MQGLRFDAKFKTLLLGVIEEEFSKSYGKPYDWKVLLKNSTVRRHFEDMKLLFNNASDIGRIRVSIERMLEYHDKYQFEQEQDEKEPEKKMYRIKRKNNFKDVSDIKSLIREVQKHPQGLLVDQELLGFTYRDIKSDIARAISDKWIKKINRDSKEQQLYLFPRQLEIENDIRQEQFTHFTMKNYLDLCSHLNAKHEGEEKKKGERKSRAKESVADLNYKLDGYLAAKEEWLKRFEKKG